LRRIYITATSSVEAAGIDRAVGLLPSLQQLLKQPWSTNLSHRLHPGQRRTRRGQRGGCHANVVGRSS